MEKSGDRSARAPVRVPRLDLRPRRQLVAAPNLTQMPDVDRTQYGLIPVHLREWLGYVWVCLADEPPSFEDDRHRRGRRAARRRRHRSSTTTSTSLEVGRRIVYDVKANWKLIIENFMECYHCATIHPELTEVLPEFADGYAAQYFVGHGAEFGEDVKGFTVDGSEGVDRHPGRQRRAGPPLLRDHDQAAGLHQPGARPRDLPPDVPAGRRPHGRRVRLALPARGGRASGKDVSRSVELFHRVNEQDFDACERCQPAMSSRAYAQRRRAGAQRAPHRAVPRVGHPAPRPGCRARLVRNSRCRVAQTIKTRGPEMSMSVQTTRRVAAPTRC